MIAEESVFGESDLAQIRRIITEGWFMQFAMDGDFDYEPGAEQSIKARAAAAGMSGSEYAYELLMANGGTGFIYLPILNYADGNLDFLQ